MTKTYPDRKKAQLFGQLVMMIAAAAVILLIIYFGFRALKTTTKDFKTLDMMDVQMTLQTAAKDVKRDYGSQKEITISLPTEVRELCFITDIASNKLPAIFRMNNPLLVNSHDDGNGNNVYFKGEKPDDFIPMKIEDITTADGLECFTPGAGKVTVVFEGTGTKTKVLRTSNAEERVARVKGGSPMAANMTLTSQRYLAQILIPEDTVINYQDANGQYIVFSESITEKVVGAPFKQMSYVYELSPNATVSTGMPFEFIVSFNAQNAREPDKLRVYYYDKTAAAWKAICEPTVKDPDEFVFRCEHDVLVVDATAGAFYAKAMIGKDIGFTKYVLGQSLV